jgi:hypothetical protein
LNSWGILKEAYIRCLDLAILLAKSRSIRSPLIVLGDLINAIDHDHRGEPKGRFEKAIIFSRDACGEDLEMASQPWRRFVEFATCWHWR